jgi:hypothetical protein
MPIRSKSQPSTEGIAQRGAARNAGNRKEIEMVSVMKSKLSTTWILASVALQVGGTTRSLVDAMVLPVDDAVAYLHPDGRMRYGTVSLSHGLYGLAPPAQARIPQGEEAKRLRAILAGLVEERGAFYTRNAEFNRFNQHQGFPEVAPFKAGELLVVLPKDEAGQVRRFAGWVVQVTSRATVASHASTFYMVDQSHVHESLKVAGQVGYFVTLAEPVSLPMRLAFGLVEGSRTVGGRKDEPYPMKATARVLMPEHWLRRLTAHERATIHGPRVAVA